MTIEYANLGPVTLAYERFGDPGHPAVVLIMGLGAQMIVWPEALCQQLAGAGYQVIRFDNRDIGESTKLNHLKPPGLLKLLLRLRAGMPPGAPYSLHDMAKDVIGLMDALKLPTAHIVGASMGGMIAQIIASRNYDRVRTLTSIMSTSGDAIPLPTRADVLLRAIRPGRPQDHLRMIEDKVEMITRLSGDGFTTDRSVLMDRVRHALQRSSDDDAGTRRQTAAILASGSRQQELGSIRAPTLVLHGAADPLIPVNHGIRTARYVRHARLEVLRGMGHDFPPALVERIGHLLLEHFACYDQQRKRGGYRPFLHL